MHIVHRIYAYMDIICTRWYTTIPTEFADSEIMSGDRATRTSDCGGGQVTPSR